MSEQERLETLLDLFVHPGWKLFMEEYQDVREHLDTLSGVKTMEDLFSKRGRLQVLDNILTYEDSVRRALDEEVE